MMMDNDFPLIGARTTDPRSPRDEFVPQDWQKNLFPRQPEKQKPEEQGPVKQAGTLGYLQQYVAGMNRYQQAGTDVPNFGVQTDYAQQAGGPLMGRTIAQGIPVGEDPIFPMGQEEFSDYVRGRLEQRKGIQNPLPEEMRRRIPGIRARLGLV